MKIFLKLFLFFGLAIFTAHCGSTHYHLYVSEDEVPEEIPSALGEEVSGLEVDELEPPEVPEEDLGEEDLEPVDVHPADFDPGDTTVTQPELGVDRSNLGTPTFIPNGS